MINEQCAGSLIERGSDEIVAVTITSDGDEQLAGLELARIDGDTDNIWVVGPP